MVDNPEMVQTISTTRSCLGSR